MNDFFDAVVACGLGLGMWCFTETPEEPAPDPVAAASCPESAECDEEHVLTETAQTAGQ